MGTWVAAIDDFEDQKKYDFHYIHTRTKPCGKYVRKRVLVEAKSGAQPGPSDLVTIDYNAYLESKVIKKPVESTYETLQPYSFRLGKGETLVGLDTAVATMQVGEKAVFLLEARVAYGDVGTVNVPPNFQVLFEMELKSVQHRQSVKKSERLRFTNSFKYAFGKYAQGLSTGDKSRWAVEFYEAAVKALNMCEYAYPDERLKADRLLLKIYTQLSYQYYKVRDHDKCCTFCVKAYQICHALHIPVPGQLYFNHGCGLLGLNRAKDAKRKMLLAQQMLGDHNEEVTKMLDRINKSLWFREQVSKYPVHFELTAQFKAVVEEVRKELCSGSRARYQFYKKLAAHEIEYLEEALIGLSYVLGYEVTTNRTRHWIEPLDPNPTWN